MTVSSPPEHTRQTQVRRGFDSFITPPGYSDGNGIMANSAQWRKRRRRKPINPAILLTSIGLSLLFGVFEQSAQSPGGAQIIRTVPESYSFAEYTVPVIKEPIAHRVVYPYSVVRGGVHDRDELVREIQRDPVVADHYSDFNASDAQIVRVRDEKRVYVSYRVDNKVYWTSREITLGRGEALISDGKNMARVRCGNRVSVDPQEPTSMEEPSPEVFEAPSVVVPADLLISATVPDEPTQLFEEFRKPFTLDPPDALPLEDRFFADEVLPFNSPDKFTPSIFFVEPDFPEVPEPNTLILVASALAAHFVLRRFASRR